MQKKLMNRTEHLYLILHVLSCFIKIHHPVGAEFSDTGGNPADMSVVRTMHQSLENYIRHALEPQSS